MFGLRMCERAERAKLKRQILKRQKTLRGTRATFWSLDFGSLEFDARQRGRLSPAFTGC